MTLSLSKWDSRSELFQHLAESPSFIVLGDKCEAPRRFFAFEADGIEIGIISNQSGPVECKRLNSTGLLLVGFYCTLTVVDCALGSVRDEILLDGTFFEFFTDGAGIKTFAVHELGVVAINSCGNIEWRFNSPDILLGWQLEGDSLQLIVMDAPAPILLDVQKGEIQPRGRTE
jgi:hypothetical protein